MNQILIHVKLNFIEDFMEACRDLVEDDIATALEELVLTVQDFSAEVKEYMQTEIHQVKDAALIIERLLAEKSTAQRTLDWYKQGQEVLTASQFATILKGPRTRGQLVLEKATPLTDNDLNKKPLCVKTQDIRPFDWGIRFEPVIKQIYEAHTSSKIQELGRIIHSQQKNLAASPDGLVSEGERKGRLVEFKAPISRQIKEEEVPKDYWMQMQIQMEVCDVPICDYFEVQFSSPAGLKEWVAPNEETTKIHYNGKVYLIGNKETEEPIRYWYPELNKDTEPSLQEEEIVLEIIPWYCTGFQLKSIERDTKWFESMQEPIKKFWEDVDAARNGLFKLPETTRKRKADECLIRDDI